MKEALEILIIDDDIVDRQVVRRHLGHVPFDVIIHEAETVLDGHSVMQNKVIDCVLLDYRLPDASGLDFLRKLRIGSAEYAPAVVMLTGSGSESIAVEAMKSGVQDYLIKEEMTADTLLQAIKNAVDVSGRQRDVEESNRKLKEMALVDTLTQVGNRHFFQMRIEHALNRARRQSEQVCLLLMDLDGFKSINDTHGHLAGDLVLQEVGRRLTVVARDSDTLARLGGDEFVLIMETGASRDGAELLANRIREILAEPISIESGEVSVGVSIGVAAFPDDGEDPLSLVNTADTAMYDAKRR